jgi:hypothetical protein
MIPLTLKSLPNNALIQFAYPHSSIHDDNHLIAQRDTDLIPSTTLPDHRFPEISSLLRLGIIVHLNIRGVLRDWNRRVIEKRFEYDCETREVW